MVMMTIFWDKDGSLPTDYLALKSTNNSPYYAFLIERLPSAMLEKHGSKVSRRVLLLHENAPVHQFDIMQAAIRQTDFIGMNYSASSLDITKTNYHMFSHLNKFMLVKNFDSDDEAIQTAGDNLGDLAFDCFLKTYIVCLIAGNARLPVKVSTFNKCYSYYSSI